MYCLVQALRRIHVLQKSLDLDLELFPLLKSNHLKTSSLTQGVLNQRGLSTAPTS